ncbi:MAG: acyl-ACP--UDP-N-acetylglucosamine O-acyltransferase [Planctomycetes bacterium]|nr:acyl-ACP--UDP-N-acetylglucosamine O-acyltransferase [Planctomycetota bacterium]
MAEIHPSVVLGPGVIVEDDVCIGEGCKIGAYTIIKGPTKIGVNNTFSSHVVIGDDPQDLKYNGGGKLSIGSGNTFREFTTIHRGHLTEAGTVIGDNNQILVGAHVGHDCTIGDGNFLANQILLAGHVVMGDFVNMSGNAGSHQFCRIGSYAMISGLSGIRQDVPPYAMVQGDPARICGINTIGLKRQGWDKEMLFKLREAFRLFRQKDFDGSIDNEYLQELKLFKEKSDRGLIKFARR